MLSVTNIRRRKRPVIGLGKFRSGVADLGTNKKHLEGFGSPHMLDSLLDLTAIPEATDAQLRRAGRVGRPSTGDAKRLIAIRIAPKLLARLRRLAAKQRKPYHTYIHELLEHAVSKKIASRFTR